MKKIFILLLSLVSGTQLLGQLSGVFPIPSGPPGFPSIAVAIATVNSAGVGPGGVIFNIAPGYVETTNDSLVLTATGTMSNPILFQRSMPGVNPKIIRADGGTKATSTLGGQGDAIFTIQGSDYVTIDGLDLFTQNPGIEYGYYLRKVSGTDGCKFITIKNAVITMNKGASGYVAGIYVSNNTATSLVSSAVGVTVTSIGGRNESVSLLSNTVQNVFAGIILRGYNHSTAPYDYLDQNCTVGAANAGNTILNYAGNTVSASYGVYIIYNTSPNVSFNTISNAGGGGSNATSTLYGIFFSSSNSGGDMVFNNNTITMNQGSTSLANCIHVTPKGTSVQICNNTFSYGAFASTTATYMINCSNATPVVTVCNNQILGNINKTGIGPFDLYYNFGSPAGGTATITNNNFANVTVTGTSTFYGIRQYTSVTQTEIITDNIVSNITGGTGNLYGIFQGYGAAGSAVKNNVVTNFNSGGPVTGIYIGSTTAPVDIDVFQNNVNTLNTTGLSVYGIQVALGQTCRVFKNNICNLKASNSSGIVYGLYLAGGTNNYVYNNFVSDLKTPVTNAAIPLAGIYVAGGTNAYVSFNSVYLNATSAGALFGSAALYASVSTALELKNNILVNKSVPNGLGGNSSAYRRSAYNLLTYMVSSNANCFYAGTPSATNLIYYDGTNSFLTMAPYKLFVGPARDASSFSEDPPFVLTACNLHMQTTVRTRCESGGIPVTTPVTITDDYDGDLRMATPDVGADEFDGIPWNIFNPANFMAMALNSMEINVSFSPNPFMDPVLIVWNNTGVFSEPVGPPPLPGMPFCDGTVLYYGLASPVIHQGLTPMIPYFYKAFSYYASEYSTGIITTAIPMVQPPQALTATAVNPHEIDLSWLKNPMNDNVILATNFSGAFGNPLNGTLYPPGTPLPGGGTVIYNGPASAFSHTGLTPLTTYFYKIWSYDIYHWYSDSGPMVSATTPTESVIITGVISDSSGMPVPAEMCNIVAYRRCNPDDTLTTTNGGITVGGGGGGGAIGSYTVNCNMFADPLVMGEEIELSFYHRPSMESTHASVILGPTPTTIFNPVIVLIRHVHLGYATASARVLIPPHSTLKIHFTSVAACGNMDVWAWNGSAWYKFRQWNNNHYCTWKYIRNDGNGWMFLVFHNNDGNMWFDLMYTPGFIATSPSNYADYAVINFGWRDRPFYSCEFGHIVMPTWTVIDGEGLSLEQFPGQLGAGGVENLAIQFESYPNLFWQDMQLMMELDHVTSPGTLTLSIPDATIPVTTATINPGDTVCFFNTGGIPTTGIHTMTISALQGTSVTLDAMIYNSLMPIPVPPSVSTLPVTNITTNSATSGGNVTATGGAPVTARGVCWGTTPNPTITGNHTTDGTGMGLYTSFVTGLAPGTTYFLRAYASNMSGVGYGLEYVFTTQPLTQISGTVTDSTGAIVPAENLYIVAHSECNPNDTLSTLNGGITLNMSGGNFTYTVNCNMFASLPQPGQRVFVNFLNRLTHEFSPETAVIGTTPVTILDVVIVVKKHVVLPYKTASVLVCLPPHSTLALHYTYVIGCGNTDVAIWNGYAWSKVSQWNWNHYCMWKYITNSTNHCQFYRIHNDDGFIAFDITIMAPLFPTSPGNNSDFALLSFGWRDRPYTSCEFANITVPSWYYSDVSGMPFSQFPQRLGAGGVENLTIQFETYDNIFWADMDMTIDISGITQPGTLTLSIPDATVPFTSATVNAGDTVVTFHPGGILQAGLHTMMLTASGGLSMGVDALVYTSTIPWPDPPTVVTSPVGNITQTTATGGGNVTATGGAPVTARGICWSTSANPTIADNHTTDGSGLGMYTSFMTGLSAGTGYFVRAYATNMAGVSYGNQVQFTTLPAEILITGTVTDTTGAIVPSDNLYIVAYNRCNPTDSLSTTNGGITLGPGGHYTVHCNMFATVPAPGDPVVMSFFDVYTGMFTPESVIRSTNPVTIFNPVVYLYRHVHLPYKTAFTWVVIPAGRTLQIHYTYVAGCGNTDVFMWNGSSWIKYRQWNWNHYCTWRFIHNNNNRPMLYVIHNDDGNIYFDMTFNCPITGITTASNYSEFALFNMGWRDRPFNSCEFGEIIAPNHLYVDYEGASLYQFPSVIGTGGVQELTVQFQSYSNPFWNDMQLMVELTNVTQQGTLSLHIPDATIPLTTATVHPGDTAAFFHTGGISLPGSHLMMLSASPGLSVRLDGMIYTTLMPIPDLPTVVTTPLSAVTPTSATAGGVVTADGGAFVTARGVCWNTSPAPTLLNNHTMDGTGLGAFTSTMTGLSPSTTYFYRAYATNLTGTSYGQEFIFTTLPPEILITGTVTDTTGLIVPSEHLYIVAYNPCNPDDSLTTLNGGITLASGGQYTVHCNMFATVPAAGDPVIMSFFDVYTEMFTSETVVRSVAPFTLFNPVIYMYRHVHLPYKTCFTRVCIPAGRTLQIHYTYVAGCGNTDVFIWNGSSWIKYRQWNWNHYCTWRFIHNGSNRTMMYVIHNDDGNIYFDMTFNCPITGITSPSNYSEFALFNMGWRDRPFNSCEFGEIIAPNHLYVDYEGASLYQFPSVIGAGGVQELTVQFQSYNNQFWNDMQLMVELTNVTQQGTLTLHIPDATIPLTTATVNPGDTAVFFHTGGISLPGSHLMMLTASPGLSVRLDGMIYTTLMPIPNLPTVVTSPISAVTPTSATAGGVVTADGGAFVTARGVCWNTSPAPTLLNNHTMDGTGLGTYTSTMTGLSPSTTYFYRAYATNLTGTSYGQEFIFTTLPPEILITGTVTDTTGLIVPSEHLYIVAYNPCNPNDTLTTLNGGITLAPGGQYTVHCNMFATVPAPGQPVAMSFFDIFTEMFTPETVVLGTTPITLFNPVIYLYRHVHLPYKTTFTRVVIPAGRTLQIHYTYVAGCGNTDVFIWNGSSWIKYRQWNWNHYCTWRFLHNNSNRPMVYVIHNDDGNIYFDMTFNCPITGITSPSNYSEFALFNMGWRDRPFNSCEFGEIIAPNHLYVDYEGASLYQFPSVIGAGGVQELTVQFQSYNNQFWNDMQLMVEMTNVTQQGTLTLHIPDATIPLTTATVNPGDTAVFFHTGGILVPGSHLMMLTASPGLSVRLDGMIYTTLMPIPNLPTVVTSPISAVTPTSATGGGIVTSDGGAFVTARGVCWNTSPSPTLLNNHTMDGTGLGTFTSVMTGLLSSTTYYVRSYATNLAGTAYGQEMMFTTLPPYLLISGIVADSTGAPVPTENLYIVAYTACNPSDTLTTLNGGITLGGAGNTGSYTIHCNMFSQPPQLGEQVFVSFHNRLTTEFSPEVVTLGPDYVTMFNPVIYLVRHVHLPFKTAYIKVVIPAGKTLQIHYTWVNGCGNTDVFKWTGYQWQKFRQWNWNHYCTWRYIQNNTARPQVYVIHNDDGNIWFDLMFNCPINPGTTPSNYSDFALVNFGWRDRPLTSCEFGNIVGVNYTYFDYEGAVLDQFPSRLGSEGVQNLAVVFESYGNMFWNDMQLMIDLHHVSSGGTLTLSIPDATIPVAFTTISPGDTVAFFHTGAIPNPGQHTMTLSSSSGLSAGIDAMIFTSIVPVPNPPVVTTNPVTVIRPTSATSGGNVTSDGGAPVTDRGVCWSTTPNPTILNNVTHDGAGTGAFTSSVTGLTPATTYYLRAYATNLSGTGYGEEKSFVTMYEYLYVSGTAGSGDFHCYDATKIITVAGLPNTFVAASGSSTIMIAGEKIKYLTGTLIKHGAYLHGYIKPLGPWCNDLYPPVIEEAVTSTETVSPSVDRPGFIIYPNPTSGSFTIEQKGTVVQTGLQLEVYDMQGVKVMKRTLMNERKNELNFSDMQPGMYFVKVIGNGFVDTFKLIKVR